ncbi:MAG: hypothetical protein HOV80_39635 [Polyangiaceae bacterium]|nr:hypothetical protein [Polyangiaceae bacterium]
MLKRCFVCLSVLATLSIASVASAQNGEDYDLRDVDGGSYSVNFKDDPLGATGNDSNIAVIRGNFRPVRMQLIRPRANFISELRKSVENL